MTGTLEEARQDAERKFDLLRRCPHTDYTITESDQRYWDDSHTAYVATCQCGICVVAKVKRPVEASQ